MKAAIKRYSANICFFNFINFCKLFSLLATFAITPLRLYRCLNVVVRVVWRRNDGQSQMNVKTKLCMSVLTFTMLTNVISTFSISTLILTTLDNVETMLLFSASHNVDQGRNNVVNMIIFKKLKKVKKIFLSFKKRWLILINNTCFYLWAIKKKGKHGMHNVKINVGKSNMK